MGFAEKETILKRDVKIFKAESSKDAAERRNKICRNCVYRSSDTENEKQAYTGGCNYILVMHEMRPCAPSKCVKKGIYKKGNRINKRVKGLKL